MELRVLNYFLMVVREENITRAAERLHLTQPTLSRQLSELEEELGVKLLIRGKRKVTLTEEGFLLRRRAEEILSLVERTEREVTESEEKLEGTVSVGGGDLPASREFIRLIHEFQMAHPLVEFRFLTAVTDILCERMDRGLIDVSLLVQPFDMEKYEALPFGKSGRWGIYMRADDPLAGQKIVNIKTLEDYPVIASNRSDILSRYFSLSGQDVHLNHVPIITNLPSNAVLMVEEGMGYFMGSEGVLPFLDESRIVFRPLTPVMLAPPALAWRRNQPFSRAAAAFIEYLKDHAEKRETVDA